MPLLLALGAAGVALPARRVPILAATAGLTAFGAAAVVTALLLDEGGASLAVPIGLPGSGIVLALDPLSGFFLLVLFLAATPCAVVAIESREVEDTRGLPFFPALVASMALTLLAADAYALVLGFALTTVASWALLLVRHEEPSSRAAARRHLASGCFTVVSLTAALGLLSSGGSSFAAMRETAPEEWTAAGVFLLALVGAGAQAGLAPLHRGLPLSAAAASGPVAALVTGAMTKVALYGLMRLVLDLCGPVQPLWWSVPVLAVGAASAVTGGFGANMGDDMKSVLASGATQSGGLITIGIGIAIIARGSDLPGLAALALAGALLHALIHGLLATVVVLAASAAGHGAGSRVMGRLGGLIHQMPRTAGCVLAGALGLAAVPPGAGFASAWLLLQSLLAAPRAGGLALQTLIAIVLALMALSLALGAAAMIRLVGIAFLGRPRTPRAAAAIEPGRLAFYAMAGLAGIATVIGLFPGPTLSLAEPALRRLTGSGLEGRTGWFEIGPAIEMPGYIAPGVAALLAVLALGAFFAARNLSVPGRRDGTAWDGGFAAPPPWLPFGDPATQYTDASFSQPLRRTLASPWPAATAWLPGARAAMAALLDRVRPLGVRATLALIGVLLLVALGVLIWLQAS